MYSHIEIHFLFSQLEEYANVRTYPSSLSAYRFQSTAVKLSNLKNIYQDKGNTFPFLFNVVIVPFLPAAVYLMSVFSHHDTIKGHLRMASEQTNYIAMSCLLSTLAWIVTATDIAAAIFYKYELGFSDPYHNNKNPHIFEFIITLIVVEAIVIICFDIVPLLLFIVIRYSEKVAFYLIILSALPVVWCISAHFGFIVVAWTSFIRHSTALTIFIVISIIVAYLSIRQIYIFIADLYFRCNGIHEERKRRERMGRDGILKKTFLVLRFISFCILLLMGYFTAGFWLLPVTELLEDAPVAIFEAFQVIFVFLAGLISYELITLKRAQNANNANHQ